MEPIVLRECDLCHLQIVPTVSSVKHTNTITSKLWRSSTIHRFIHEQASRSARVDGMRNVQSPIPSAGTASRSRSASPARGEKKKKSSYEIEDICEILNTFRRENGDNVELSEKLQAVTADLKLYMHNAEITKALEIEPTCDRFYKAKTRIEAAIDDTHLHMAMKTAIIRYILRDVGVFTWNSDVEGMIFGYGDPAHGPLVIENMPQTMKDFCMENEKALSGVAFEAYMTGRVTPKSATPYLKSRNSPSVAPVNDYDRILYLIESAPAGYILSSALSKLYRKAFASPLTYTIDGGQVSLTGIIERLKNSVSVKVTALDCTVASLWRGKGQGVSKAIRNKRGNESGMESDDDALSVGSDGASDVDAHWEGGNDEDEGEEEGEDVSDVDEEVNGDGEDDDFDFRRYAPGGSHGQGNVRVASTMPTCGPNRRRFSGKNTKRSARQAASDRDQIYKLEWVGQRPQGRLVEPDGHVFRNPQYWMFVGHVLHGGRDRGGWWKRLPWAVLKDVILSTKRMKVVDNTVGVYMRPEHLKKHGKQAANSPIHVGLQDLLEWMEDMESRSIVAADDL